MRSPLDRAPTCQTPPSPRCSARGASSRSHSPAIRAWWRWSTRRGTAMRSASRCRRGCLRHCSSPWPMRSANSSSATRARTGRLRPSDVGMRFGLPLGPIEAALTRLTATGRIVEGAFRPGGRGREWCDAEVLRSIRRRSLARLRQEVEPVETPVLGRFLTAWHGIGRVRGGLDALLDTIEQLQGIPLVASLLEHEILPARLADYAPSQLDTLLGAGEVSWVGVEPLGDRDGRIALYLTDHMPRLLPPSSDEAPLTGREPDVVEEPARRRRGVLRGSPCGDRRRVSAGNRRRAVVARVERAGDQRHVPRAARLLAAAGTIPPILTHRAVPLAAAGAADRRRTLDRDAGRLARPPSLRSPSGQPRSRSSCSRATASSREKSPPSNRSPAASARSIRCCGAWKKPAGCAAATSSPASARRSSRSQAPSISCAAAREERDAPLAVTLAATDPANPYGALLAWPDWRAATAPTRRNRRRYARIAFGGRARDPRRRPARRLDWPRRSTDAGLRCPPTSPIDRASAARLPASWSPSPCARRRAPRLADRRDQRRAARRPIPPRPSCSRLALPSRPWACSCASRAAQSPGTRCRRRKESRRSGVETGCLTVDGPDGYAGWTVDCRRLWTVDRRELRAERNA